MRRLWHNPSMKSIERKRYFEPLTATTALALMTALGGTAGVGYGISSLFGKKKKAQQDDPLAGIRQQLMDLSSGVPALVARRKEAIKNMFADYQKTGMENIQENVHAERGFGKTSLESSMTTDFMDKLAKSQAEEELNADFQGLQTQGNLLRLAGGMGVTAPTAEEPSFMSQILGMGSQLAFQQAGMSGLEELFNPKVLPTDDLTYENFTGDLLRRPGSKYS